MSPVEFRRWREYYRLFPFDDRHRYHRPAALIAASSRSNVQQGFADFIEFLEPDPALAHFSGSDVSILRAFGLRPPPRKS